MCAILIVEHHLWSVLVGQFSSCQCTLDRDDERRIRRLKAGDLRLEGYCMIRVPRPAMLQASKSENDDMSTLISLSLTVLLFPYFDFLLLTIMVDDFLLVVLTIRALWPGSFCLPSLSCAAFFDWSVLIAAYRLAAVVSAALK